LTQTTIVIRRPITILLLVCVTAIILAVTLGMSGRTYSGLDPVPFEDVRHLAHRLENHPVSMRVISLIIVPIIMNVLLFVPFGFFLFITFYTVERPTIPHEHSAIGGEYAARSTVEHNQPKRRKVGRIETARNRNGIVRVVAMQQRWDDCPATASPA
jgi:hypothetical protein